jgi:nicotinate-nucleotide adenylyltransferase
MVKSALKINKKDRLGIFSGSFDPPHKGHLYISKIFIKKIKLKNLIWSVSKKNPLVEKSYFYNHNQRINLSKKITKNISKIFINNFDKKYSYQLINSIKKKYKNNKIFF